MILGTLWWGRYLFLYYKIFLLSDLHHIEHHIHLHLFLSFSSHSWVWVSEYIGRNLGFSRVGSIDEKVPM